MQISVVIPTCNRKQRLLSLLQCLQYSSHPLLEVIIVDSGEDQLLPEAYAGFKNLAITYIESKKSVCIQRNEGIRRARGEWIFLCDDDMEVPADYLQKLFQHAAAHPKAGAISGRVLQKEGNNWVATYPITSPFQLLWKFIFQLGIWGEINCSNTGLITRKLKTWYKRKGNHISRAGWPVLTDFSGDFSCIPLYTLGASLIKRDWLLFCPYDEVLDKHGIGDHYGVAMDIPSPIHLVNDAFVYHHLEPVNRLQRPLQYYRRMLALHYFIKTKPVLKNVHVSWLAWSLIGNLIIFLIKGEGRMVKAAFRSWKSILLNTNPYLEGSKATQKVIEPVF